MEDILKAILAPLPTVTILLLMPENQGFLLGLFIFISLVVSIINSLVLLEKQYTDNPEVDEINQ